METKKVLEALNKVIDDEMANRIGHSEEQAAIMYILHDVSVRDALIPYGNQVAIFLENGDAIWFDSVIQRYVKMSDDDLKKHSFWINKEWRQ